MLGEKALPSIARAFANTGQLDQLFATATTLVADTFGIDRVMIYQFDEDKHGCVVGESKQPELEPFLGLHYPETDIPKIARDLFLKFKSRFISDITVENTYLQFSPSAGTNPSHLDLSYSQLRATSPIHIEYLANMGVTASLSISIVVNGELWGLIACHQGTALRIPFDLRMIAETIGDLLAKRIFELDFAKKAKQDVQRRKVEQAFLGTVEHSENYRVEILENVSAIMGMCENDGVALVTLDDCPYSQGQVP